MPSKAKTAGILALAAVFFILDRALKRLFVGVWQHADFRICGDWFSLKLSLNKGVAFSFPMDARLAAALAILALAAMGYAAWLNYKKSNFLIFFSLAMIIAGAYSNLLDRLMFGAVIDYFNLEDFSVFNLADILITGGLGLLAVLIFGRRRSAPVQKKVEPAG